MNALLALLWLTTSSAAALNDAATLPSPTTSETDDAEPADPAGGEPISDTPADGDDASDRVDGEPAEVRPPLDAPAQTSADDAERAPPPITLYFVGLESEGLTPEQTAIVDAIVLAALVDHVGTRVSSSRQIDAALERAARTQERACYDESESCVREVARTLGTRHAVAGSARSVDGVTSIELVLLDTATGLPIGREHLSTRSPSALRARIDAVVTNLLAPLSGLEKIPVPDERAPLRFDDAAVLIPILTASAAIGVSSAFLTSAVVAWNVAGQLDGSLAGTYLLGAIGVALGLPLAAAFALAVASLVVDVVGETNLDAPRALLMSATAVGVGAFMTPLLLTASITSQVLLLAAFATASGRSLSETRISVETAPLFVLTGATTAIATSAALAAATATATLVTFALASKDEGFDE